jgi:hypothetical protein
MENLDKIEKELAAGECQHVELEHKVEINQMKPKEGGGISTHELSIKVQCAHCGVPFHFTGVDQGTSFRRPMADHRSVELRAPIGPGELPMTYQTFETAPANFVEMMLEDEASDGLPPDLNRSPAGDAPSDPPPSEVSDEEFERRAAEELTRRDKATGDAFGEAP